MRRLAFATCEPRQPMWEDDLAAAAVLGEAGVEVDFVAWDRPGVDWEAYDRVVVRSTWDYSVRLGEFLGWTESIGADRLRNSPEIIRWNTALCIRLSQLSTRGERLATTMSLPLPRPLGCCLLLELSRMRAELQAEAASTTTRPFRVYSLRSSLLI